MQEVSHNWFL